MPRIKRRQLISVCEFARRNRVSSETVQACIERGGLPHVNGRIDAVAAQPAWEALIKRRSAITFDFSPEEYAELEVKASALGLTVPQYLRLQMGLPPSVEGPC